MMGRREGDSREQSMMGRREGGQGQFFYAFDLDKVVPPDHLVPARPRRRGDRIAELFYCGVLGRDWHEASVRGAALIW